MHLICSNCQDRSNNVDPPSLIPAGISQSLQVQRTAKNRFDRGAHMSPIIGVGGHPKAEEEQEEEAG